jgi:hypothetical protein
MGEEWTERRVCERKETEVKKEEKSERKSLFALKVGKSGLKEENSKRGGGGRERERKKERKREE